MLKRAHRRASSGISARQSQDNRLHQFASWRARPLCIGERDDTHHGMHNVTIGNFTVANDRPFTLIAGPCALESRQHALEMSAALKEITARLAINLVYKTS